MNDLPFHFLLFGLIGAAIVVIGSFFTELEDGPALRSVPRRLLVFFVGCAIVAAVILTVEHTFAAIS